MNSIIVADYDPKNKATELLINNDEMKQVKESAENKLIKIRSKRFVHSIHHRLQIGGKNIYRLVFA